MLKRAIPVLTINDGDLVKNKQFKDYKYLGDPINAVKIFNEKGVDEIIILDITKNKNGPDLDLIKSFVDEAFMPLTYGGGISNIEQMKKIFRLGVEKISLNSEININPSFVLEAISYFGSQSIIASIDYKTHLFSGKKCYTNNGQDKINISPKDLARKYEKLGFGEILLTSIELEGTKKGYDFETLKEVVDCVNIPVVINGGAKNRSELIKAIDIYKASGSAAGALFCLQGVHDAVLISYNNLN